MKGKIALVCLLSSLFLPLMAQEHLPSAKKYYCAADQIELTDSMILVHLEDQIFELDSLFVDQGGIYFVEDMLRCTFCRRTLNPQNSCDCLPNCKPINPKNICDYNPQCKPINPKNICDYSPNCKPINPKNICDYNPQCKPINPKNICESPVNS